jgi:hypothetical protein
MRHQAARDHRLCQDRGVALPQRKHTVHPGRRELFLAIGANVREKQIAKHD